LLLAKLEKATHQLKNLPLEFFCLLKNISERLRSQLASVEQFYKEKITMITNSVVISGNTATEVRLSEDGRCASVLLAHTEFYRDQQGQKQETTNFLWVRAYGKLAHNLSEYVLKGNSITVTGKLAGGSYKDEKTGEWQNSLYVLAANVQFHTRSLKQEFEENSFSDEPVTEDISF
jgi:single stranded DNA-binding protein